MTAAQSTVPVKPDDKVSQVLERDEALLDVFVRHAPHFEKLRNVGMRRVMAALVTVEQAARTAGASPDRLVNDLNEALGFARDRSEPSTVPQSSHEVELPLRHPPSARVVELDVREDLRLGREPFSRILSAASTLGDDDVLHLRAIFEPVPLFTVLGQRGFMHESHAHAADDWSVWFWRPGTVAADPSVDKRAPDNLGDTPPDDERTTHLDVRGLNPPEPMMRTLSALESLPVGHTLVQINNRVPQFLLPVLAERGFAYEIDESCPDRVVMRISHAQ